MKTFVIGDIHGCYDEFKRMMEQIKPDLKKDQLIMLGDYIDRRSQELGNGQANHKLAGEVWKRPCCVASRES